MQRQNQKRTTFGRSAVIGTTALLGLALPVLGGLQGPVSDVHTWLGGVGDADWSTAANWNTGQVPGQGDAAIISSGPSLGVVLSEDTALLDSVYISGGMWLSNVGHRILISGAPSTMTVTQANSILQLTTETSNGKAIDVDELKIQNGAELQMAGGRAEVDVEFRATNGGVITGYGRIDVLGAQNAAFGAVGGTIDVDGGTLRINMVNDGTMSLSPEIDIFGADSRLRLDGPLHAPLDDVDMGGGGRLSVRENWTLDGSLSASQGTATIDGDGRGTFEGTVSTSTNGALVFDGEVEFASTGEISLGGILSSMRLNGLWFVDPGHETSIGWGSRLIFGEDSDSFFGWNGDIDVNGGVVEVRTHTTFAGDFVADNGAIGSTPRLQGDAAALFEGDLTVNAANALFEADFSARPGSSVNVTPGATLRIAGVGTIRGGANVFGGGVYEVTDTGTLTADGGEMIAAEVVNDGRLEPGQPTGQLTIWGDYTQGSTGALGIQIAGAGVGQADRVDVASTVELAGTLEVAAIGGYEPPSGSSFAVLTANSVVGTFDQIVGPPGMQVDYYADQVIVTFDGCPADLTGNGHVGFEDLLDLLELWGACGGCDADLNGNGDVDFDDLIDLLNAWGPC